MPAVVSNPDRVEQLLVILLDNAIKYTPGGGTVSLDAAWNDARVTLIVKDTGIGIAKEDLPYVFDRFYKVDKAHSGMGSGLGLSIARELLSGWARTSGSRARWARARSSASRCAATQRRKSGRLVSPARFLNLSESAPAMFLGRGHPAGKTGSAARYFSKKT